MDDKKAINEIKFDLLENGLDFVLSALDLIIEPKTETQLKYSILHLSAGIELILKERLRNEHWTLIFENTNSANTSDLSSGDFQSVNLENALIRLENVCGIIIPDKDKQYLRELRKRRNRIEHFAFKEIEPAIKSLASKVLSIIFTFITESFDHNSLTDKSQEQIEILRKNSKKFTEFIDLRLAQIKDELIKQKKSIYIIRCPMCYQESFILADDLKCLFCGYSDTPETAAENYVENVLRVNRYYEVTQGGHYPLEECPDCGNTTMVDDGETFICFTCLSKWDRDEFNDCSGCGQLYRVHEGDYIDVCESCLSYRIEKFGE